MIKINKKLNKKGQITIFIILGIVLLFMFLFVFLLAEKVKINNLEQEKEEVFSKVFEVEGLRIYIEGCLSRELKSGLELIGRQGGLWKGDAGGTTVFEEGLTGTSHPVTGETVKYGISFARKGYSPINLYPCEEGEEPVFCQYWHENGSLEPGDMVKFGQREIISKKTIENNLEKFLINRTQWCMEEYTRINLFTTAEVSSEGIEMDLKILDNGINIEIEYPLRLTLDTGDFFQLTTFDLFYKSKLKEFLEAAVINPIKMDWSFATFDLENGFDDETFDFFGEELQMKGAEFQDLGITFKKVSVEGDDIFSFTANNIIENQPYQFQFARQNRPPALDYISREACVEDNYDYLVMLGEEGEGGEVKITPTALDPDEDEVNYKFGADWKETDGEETDGEGTINDGVFTYRPTSKGWYELIVSAIDQHGLADWQKVRILVDRVMKTSVGLRLPYEELNYQTEGTYVLSREDPVFLTASWPEDSEVKGQQARATLNYKSDTEPFELELPEPLVIKKSGDCFNLPWDEGVKATCLIDDYEEEDLINWFSQEFDMPYFRKVTGSNSNLLKMKFEILYCEDNEKEDVIEKMIFVAECVPHQNPNYPFAYPYYTYRFGLKEDGMTDFDNFLGIDEEKEAINPFMATHSCCFGKVDAPQVWRIYREEEKHVCFVSPEQGCYGGSDYADGKKGYVLERQQRLCDGTRGNICGGEIIYEENKICGDPIYERCSNDIPIQCRGEKAGDYGEIKGERGWCYGELGCERFCSQETGEELVYNLVGGSPEGLPIDIISFKCGCGINDEGKVCDGDFDGNFEGVCQKGGECK